MNIIPIGDYYIVYCDWCDSDNKVLWTRMGSGNAYCGACHHPLLPTLKAGEPVRERSFRLEPAPAAL